MQYQQLTKQIIGSFYSTYNELGYGFREKVYENALSIELTTAGLRDTQQHPIKVYFRGQEIGEYYADLLVEEQVLVEIKANKILVADNEAQLLNYLKATHIEVGLLFNFGAKPEFKRKYFSNARKGHLKWTSPNAQ